MCALSGEHLQNWNIVDIMHLGIHWGCMLHPFLFHLSCFSSLWTIWQSRNGKKCVKRRILAHLFFCKQTIWERKKAKLQIIHLQPAYLPDGVKWDWFEKKTTCFLTHRKPSLTLHGREFNLNCFENSPLLILCFPHHLSPPVQEMGSQKVSTRREGKESVGGQQQSKL